MATAPRHTHTDATPLGIAKPSGRAKHRLWDLSLPVPKSAPPVARPSRMSAEAAVDLEMRTAKALTRLRQKLAELLRAELGPQAKLRALTFERWRFAAVSEEQSAMATEKKRAQAMVHPVIPAVQKCGRAHADLAKELQLQGISVDASVRIVEAFKQEVAQFHKSLTQRAHRFASGQAADAMNLSVKFHNHTVEMLCAESVVRCTRDAYGKLAVLHRRHASAEERAPPIASSKDKDADEERTEVDAAAAEDPVKRKLLHERMFAMLLRYKSLQGHGFQAAIGKPVWEVLQKYLEVGCECFASPLNAYLPAFGSAFADVDSPFGSRGSFFNFKATAGSFAANPPFVHEVMDATAQHVLSILAAASSAPGGPALSFAVIIPGWKENSGFQAMDKSAFLRDKFVIAASDHGFADGASHQRQDPYRYSPFDTCVFILQTDKAKRKWPTSDNEFETALRSAFGACVPSESAVQRQTRKPIGGAGKSSSKKMKKKGARASKVQDPDERAATSGVVATGKRKRIKADKPKKKRKSETAQATTRAKKRKTKRGS